ncbi:MAG TPA: hypothetical protein VGO31_10320 [Microbacteriaceae bacterium]|nr:hypothetical protein [Microbacteriaceae bacterium]
MQDGFRVLWRSTIAHTAQPVGPVLAGVLLDAYSARVAIAVLLICNAARPVAGWLTPALRELPQLGEIQPA